MRLGRLMKRRREWGRGKVKDLWLWLAEACGFGGHATPFSSKHGFRKIIMMCEVR